jgi:hypothetical protein
MKFKFPDFLNFWESGKFPQIGKEFPRKSRELVKFVIHPNEVYILSGPSMKHGRPEAHPSLSHFILRQYLLLWKK